jgi:hypothetical protein
MINHVRTLLLNKARGGYGPETPGEEYVPVDFLPVVESAVVKKVRQTLFGTAPDRHMLNYRLHQLMPLLHVTELEQYLLALDDRTTYWPSQETRLYRDAFVPSINPIGNFDGDLALIDTLIANEQGGQMRYWWEVEVTSGSTVNVKQLLPPHGSATTNYVLTNGRSNVIALLGSSMSFTFSGPAGAVWHVDALARPERTLAELLGALKAGITLADELTLFGTNPAEPYRTFRNLWNDNEKYAYQAAGLLMAVAYRMSEVS